MILIDDKYYIPNFWYKQWLRKGSLLTTQEQQPHNPWYLAGPPSSRSVRSKSCP